MNVTANDRLLYRGTVTALTCDGPENMFRYDISYHHTALITFQPSLYHFIKICVMKDGISLVWHPSHFCIVTLFQPSLLALPKSFSVRGLHEGIIA